MKRSTRIAAALTLSTALGGIAILPAVADDGAGDRPSERSSMAQMHERMMEENSGMAQMHELMMQGNPGMVQMHQRMMGGHMQHGRR